MTKDTNKTTKNEFRVASFLADIDDAARRADAKRLAKWMQEITGEKPAMWGSAIVGFGAHRYKYESGREGDMPKVSFSPRKSALVLYLSLGDNGHASLLKKLGKHKAGKGCLYINKLADVDELALKDLIARSFARLDEEDD